MPSPNAPRIADEAADLPPTEIAWESPLWRDHPLVGRIWSVARGEWVAAAALEADLAEADFVLLGERHDNMDHHALQARLLEAMIRGGRRPALALEMIDADRQGAIDALDAPAPERLARAVRWGDGWGHFERYRAIVATALEAGLPIVAANFPIARARALVRQGLEALEPSEATRLGLDRPMAPEHREALAEELRESHCGHPMPDSMIEGMALAQRARDASMANRMLEAGAEEGAVLIAGAGHVRRDRGVPSVLIDHGVGAERIRALSFVEVTAELGTPESFAGSAAARELPYDYVWFTPAADREDPCAAFRRHMERRTTHDE